jgi:hypothetical protein
LAEAWGYEIEPSNLLPDCLSSAVYLPEGGGKVILLNQNKSFLHQQQSIAHAVASCHLAGKFPEIHPRLLEVEVRLLGGLLFLEAFPGVRLPNFINENSDAFQSALLLPLAFLAETCAINRRLGLVFTVLFVRHFETWYGRTFAGVPA